ncbi:unnamed protein product [Mytilus coruscus]|uniref:Uncharacterized protein n=1 Tax=Mytilus coruscus TaxID=42192 RepID=A0A6J8DQF3_MYTCO|nr:unnamed protein product [Mytilus coruscus]
MADVGFTSICTHSMPFFGTGSDLPFLQRVNLYLESVENAKIECDQISEDKNIIEVKGMETFDRKQRFRRTLRIFRAKEKGQQRLHKKRCNSSETKIIVKHLSIPNYSYFYTGKDIDVNISQEKTSLHAGNKNGSTHTRSERNAKSNGKISHSVKYNCNNSKERTIDIEHTNKNVGNKNKSGKETLDKKSCFYDNEDFGNQESSDNTSCRNKEVLSAEINENISTVEENKNSAKKDPIYENHSIIQEMSKIEYTDDLLKVSHPTDDLNEFRLHFNRTENRIAEQFSVHQGVDYTDNSLQNTTLKHKDQWVDYTDNSLQNTTLKHKDQGVDYTDNSLQNTTLKHKDQGVDYTDNSLQNTTLKPKDQGVDYTDNSLQNTTLKHKDQGVDYTDNSLQNTTLKPKDQWVDYTDNSLQNTTLKHKDQGVDYTDNSLQNTTLKHKDQGVDRQQSTKQTLKPKDKGLITQTTTKHNIKT